MTAPAPPRALRLCDVCGQLDDHPRHVFGVGPDHPDAVPSREFLASLGATDALALAELLDPATVVRHMDCCAARGCPDLTCDQILADADGARGDDLVDHITGQEA